MAMGGMFVKKDDTVVVIAGKDKGKKGKVLTALPTKNKIVVEKINIVKKHAKANPNKHIPGGIIERPAPLSVSKVMLLCNQCGKATRIEKVIVEGKKVRKCKRCGELIDKV
jgi:large subunit ribosomal protein L24